MKKAKTPPPDQDATRPAAAPQRSRTALACAPISHCGSPATRSRGLLPVTPRQACPVALARRQPAGCRPGALLAARRGVGEASVASTTQRVYSRRDCGKIAFEIPVSIMPSATSQTSRSRNGV
jgi:hypothetical protein